MRPGFGWLHPVLPVSDNTGAFGNAHNPESIRVCAIQIDGVIPGVPEAQKTPQRPDFLNPACNEAAMSTNHIAAIHVLKAQLGLSDDDYRALLLHLTGHASSRDMSPLQRAQVRNHLQRLAERMGVVRPRGSATVSARERDRASPQERKVWALWNQLHRDGLVRDCSARALNAWVQRQVGVSALRFANAEQLHALIEALKQWERRSA